MGDLKPCPFCGGAAAVRSHGAGIEHRRGLLAYPSGGYVSGYAITKAGRARQCTT